MNLEKLVVNGTSGDKECAITVLDSLLAVINESNRVNIKSANEPIYMADEMLIPALAQPIFVCKDKFYIPEYIVAGRLQNVSYLDTYSIVEILLNTSFNGKRILDDKFYTVIKVVNIRTGITSSFDCLVVDLSCFRNIKKFTITGTVELEDI